MPHNVLCLILVGLLVWLFIWAPGFTRETAELLSASAERAKEAAKAGRWAQCEDIANEILFELENRKTGLKVLLDHEDVDALFQIAAVAAAAAKQKAAGELELELAAFCAMLEYVRDIDRLLWVNYL